MAFFSILNFMYLYSNKHFVTCIWRFCLSVDSIWKGLLYVWTISKTRREKVRYKTRLSTVSIEVIILLVMCLIQRPCQQIDSFARSYADWRFHTYCKAIINHRIIYRFTRFPDYDKDRVWPFSRGCLLLHGT